MIAMLWREYFLPDIETLAAKVSERSQKSLRGGL
jgi:hypothetical protein